MKNRPLKQKSIPRGYGAPGDGDGRDGDIWIRYIKGSGIFIFYKWLNRWYSSRLSPHKPRSSEKNEPVFLPTNKKPSKIPGELSYDGGKFIIGKGSQKVNQILSVNKAKVADVDTLIMTRSSQVGTDIDSGDPDILFENTGHVHVRLFNPAASASAQYDIFHSYARLHPETFSVAAWTVGVDVSDAFKMKWGHSAYSSSLGSRESKNTPSTSGINRMTLTQAGALSTASTITAGADGFIGKFEDIVTSRIKFTNVFGVINPVVSEGSHIHLDTAVTMVDNVTSASGTRTRHDVVMIEPMSFGATNASVTTTRASTFTIGGPPTAGANMTLTNAHALRIQRGSIYVDDTIAEGHDYIVNGNMTLDINGDLTLDAASDDIIFKDAGTEFGRINMTTASTLKLKSATNYDLHLMSQGTGDVILDSASGAFIAKRSGTEFSAADSAYAGMVLGYTMIRNVQGYTGDNTAGSTISIGSSWQLVESASGTKMSITWKAPPSGKTELVFNCGYILSDEESLSLSLSASHSSYSSVGDMHEYDNFVYYGDEIDKQPLRVSWVFEGLTPGVQYALYLWAKSSGTTYFYQGEQYHDGATYFHEPMTMKAVALPATITSGD